MLVVRWVDENGVVKTSVTCMPPNAKSSADSSSLTNGNAKANASTANNTFYPTFEAHTTSPNEDNLHELAKSYHWREFGNGNANGGTSGTWKDLSMFDGSNQDLAYVMDDGLTSMSYDGAYRTDSIHYLRPNNSSVEGALITFIGTGFTIEDHDGTHRTVQNLPYGSHVINCKNPGDTSGEVYIDGVRIHDGTFNSMMIEDFINFYQPKKPPIPEEAVVLSDYMVFADFKPQTDAGIQLISKGVRSVSASRDFFINDTGSNSLSLDLSVAHKHGFKISSGSTSDSDTTITFRLPSFGINYVSRGVEHDTRKKLFLDTTDKDSDSTKNNSASGSYAHLTSNLDLGVYKFGTNIVSGQYSIFEGFDVVTPTHTSHHYQSFETPYLHELIGGDRSMEQTNLICSSDGKSWDEITRDTSYIGNGRVLATTDTAQQTHTAVLVFDEHRGEFNTLELYNKDFAIGYDRFICLKAGTYKITSNCSTNYHQKIQVNGSVILQQDPNTAGVTSSSMSVNINLVRGDYVQKVGGNQLIAHDAESSFLIERI